ncbi:MAG: efflux transporter outer membrane subunit [Desulfobacteraceae bacterium]|nr:efflux transporter outer membrane subunit [Desulfobacteraceae bacterium]
MKTLFPLNPRMILFSIFAAAAVCMVYGCSLGPEYQRPDIKVAVPDRYDNASGATEPIENRITGGDRWWLEFGDPEISRIAGEVLKHNWDIRRAAAVVAEFRAGLIISRSDRFPTTGLDFSAERTHRKVKSQTMGDITIGPSGRVIIGPGQTRYTDTTEDFYNLSLPMSYEIDLWGRIARANEAALADLLAADENRRAVTHSVVAETISTYLELEALERRMVLAKQNIDNHTSALKLVEGRYNLGLSDVLAVRQAKRALAQAQSELSPLRQALGETQQALAVLMGRYPETRPPRIQSEDYFKRLNPVPPGMPAELLRRRPDILAAEAALQAANARIGEAHAARFPRISLTGRFGYASSDLDDLLSSRRQSINYGADLLAPLFNAGRLKAAENATAARYDRAVADYAKIVLTAFSEVEGALLRRKELLDKRDRILNLVKEAAATLEAAEMRYQRGVSGYLNVLEAQRANYSARESLVMADLSILTNRVSLHRALGGGFN